MGTLEGVLHEAGFHQEGNLWIARKPIAAELLSVS